MWHVEALPGISTDTHGEEDLMKAWTSGSMAENEAELLVFLKVKEIWKLMTG